MNDTTAPAGRPVRTVKVPHLVMALLFLGAVGVWALVASDSVGPDQVAFLAPGVLVAAGVLGLLASVLSARNRGRRSASTAGHTAGRTATPTVGPPAPHPVDAWHDTPTDPQDDLPAPPRDDVHDDAHDDLEHTAPLTPAQPDPARPYRPEEQR